MNTTHTKKLTLLGLVAVAVGLAACNKHEDKTAGQQLDQAIATTEQRTEEARATASQEIAQAKASTEAAADKMGDQVKATADMVGNKVADAAITASVNAELAKDAQLSALKINVDTNNGRVLLKGTAPTAEARDRATRLTQAVKGVSGVDNQLEIRS